jgi:hypothetical protein
MPTFPYANSNNAMSQLIDQLKKRFPPKIDSGVLKTLNIAPNNESYVINALKFINVVTPEGIPNPDVHDLFVEGAEEFAKGFAVLVENAYKPLFDLHGDTVWTLDLLQKSV